MAADEITRGYALKNNMTPNGKFVTYEAVRGSHMLKVKFEGGGELPKELSGLYTGVAGVQAAISVYLNSKWNEHEAKQEKARGKAA